MKICILAECNSKTKARGYCSHHYNKKLAAGEFDHDMKRNPDRDRKCSVDDCDNRIKQKLMCSKHFKRFLRSGTTELMSKEQWKERCRNAAIGRSTDGQKSYKKLHNRHEHRVVAEQKIGRPLLKGEIVHHIDGNIHNNSPENLEVLTQSEHIALHRAEMNAARWKNRNDKTA